MKACLLVIWLPIAVLARTHTKEESDALSKGALACVTLRVVDERGTVVANAIVTGSFHMHDGNGAPYTGNTDTNGIYVASGRSVGDWHYYVMKDGYYRTHKSLWFFDNEEVPIKDGRWQPFGATNTVVLKRKVNPVAMAVPWDSKDHNIPFVNKEIGFDLFENDWVTPSGKGKRADLYVVFEWDGSKFQNYNGSVLALVFKDAYSGAYKIEADEFSEFKSPYHANTNGVFAKEMKFRYVRGRKASETFNGQLKGDECLILRVRTKLDEKGNMISAYYAKIYAPMMFGYALETPGSMEMRYYLNPNANDPNLEADTMKNILNPHNLGFPP